MMSAAVTDMSQVTSTIPDTSTYDHKGAMMFLVFVLAFIGTAVIITVWYLITLKSPQSDIDAEVSHFERGLEAVRWNSRKEDVLRNQLRWPGNLILPRHSGRPARQLSATSSITPQSQSKCDIRAITSLQREV